MSKNTTTCSLTSFADLGEAFASEEAIAESIAEDTTLDSFHDGIRRRWRLVDCRDRRRPGRTGHARTRRGAARLPRDHGDPV